MVININLIYILLIEKLKYFKKPIEPNEIDMLVPALEFHYKFSTLSARYEIEIKKKFHFILEIIAIIGAMYAFFEILTNYSH